MQIITTDENYYSSYHQDNKLITCNKNTDDQFIHFFPLLRMLRLVPDCDQPGLSHSHIHKDEAQGGLSAANGFSRVVPF